MLLAYTSMQNQELVSIEVMAFMLNHNEIEQKEETNEILRLIVTQLYGSSLYSFMLFLMMVLKRLLKDIRSVYNLYFRDS